MLIARQNMHFCLGLATHATVIDKRQIVYTG
jgi:branched-chain amino acid transport system ATP-binding protein